MLMSDWSSDVCSSDLTLYCWNKSGEAELTTKIEKDVDSILDIGLDVASNGNFVCYVYSHRVAGVGGGSLACSYFSTISNVIQFAVRSYERRVGKECVITCISRWKRNN